MDGHKAFSPAGNQSNEALNSAQSNNEKLQHEVNENYFERANASFRKALITGKYEKGKTLEEISNTDQKSWWKKALDAIKSPKAAIAWVGTLLMDKIGGTWFAEITGITKKLDDMRQSITDSLNAPYLQSKKALEDLKNDPDLKQFDFSNPTNLAKSITVLGKTPKAEFSKDLFKVNLYLQTNPAISANATETDKQSPEFWTKIFTDAKADPKHHENLLAIMTNKKTTAQVLKELGTAGVVAGAASTGTKENETTQADNTSPEEINSNNVKKREKVEFGGEEYKKRLEKHNQNLKNNPGNLLISPYYVSLKEGTSYIEAQYFVDETRLKQYELSTKSEKLFQENKNKIIAAGVVLPALLWPVDSSISSLTNNLSDIAKLPFALGGIPIALITAAISGLYLYSRNNPDIPYNLEEAHTEILQELENENPSLFQTLKNKYPNLEHKFKQALKMISSPELPNIELNLVENIKETVNSIPLSPEALVQKRNEEGIQKLINNLQQKEINSIKTGDNSTQIKNLITLLKQHTNNKLTPEISNSLIKSIEEFPEFIIKLEEGIYFLHEINPETNEPIEVTPLFINPSLKIEEQAEVGKSYMVFNQGFSEQAGDAWLTELRSSLDDFRNGEGGLALVGGTAVLITKSGYQYFLGSWATGAKLISTLFSGDDIEMNAQEFGVEYFGLAGSMTVFTIGKDAIKTLASPLTSKGFTRHIGAKTLLRGLTSPIGFPCKVLTSTILNKNTYTSAGRAKMLADLSALRDNKIAQLFSKDIYHQQRLRRIQNFMDTYLEVKRTTQFAGSQKLGSFFKKDGFTLNKKQQEKIYELINSIADKDAKEWKPILTALESKTTTVRLQTIRQALELLEPQAQEILKRGVTNSELDPSKFSIGTTDDIEKAKKFRYENAGKKSIGAAAADLAKRAGTVTRTQLGKIFKLPKPTKKGVAGTIVAGAAAAYAVDEFVLDKSKADQNINLQNTNELLSTSKLDETSKIQLQNFQNAALIPLSENSVFSDLTKLEKTYISGDLKAFNNQSILAKTSTPEINVDDFAEHTFPSYIKNIKEYITQNKAAVVQLLKSLKEEDLKNFKGVNELNFLPFTEEGLAKGELQLCNGFLTLELDKDNIKIKTSSEKYIKDTLYSRVDLNETLQDSNPKLLKEMDDIYDGTAEKLNNIFSNTEIDDDEKAIELQKVTQEYAINLAKLKDQLTALTNADTVQQLILDFLPISGTYQDAKRVKKSMERGDWGQAGINSLSYLFSALVDTSTFLTAGLTTPAAIAARAAKTAENMKTLLLKVVPSIDKVINNIKANATATKITKVLTFLPKKAGQIATSPFTLLMGLDLYRVSDSNQETIETI